MTTTMGKIDWAAPDPRETEGYELVQTEVGENGRTAHLWVNMKTNGSIVEVGRAGDPSAVFRAFSDPFTTHHLMLLALERPTEPTVYRVLSCRDTSGEGVGLDRIPPTA